MAEHNTLTGSSLHEPKGAAALTGGTADEEKTYQSDGAGAGTWGLPNKLKSGWRDLLGNFTAGKTSTSPPTFAPWIGGLYAWRFAVGNQLFLTFHVDHDYKVGTDFYPHVHWSPASAIPAGQTVTWEIEWTAARGHDQEAFPATTTITTTELTYTAPAGGTPANQHIVTEVAAGETVPNCEPDVLVVARVARGAGTFSGNVFGFALDAHMEIDRYATLNRSPDFYT